MSSRRTEYSWGQVLVNRPPDGAASRGKAPTSSTGRQARNHRGGIQRRLGGKPGSAGHLLAQARAVHWPFVGMLEVMSFSVFNVVGLPSRWPIVGRRADGGHAALNRYSPARAVWVGGPGRRLRWM